MKAHFLKHGTTYGWILFYFVSLLLIPTYGLVGDDSRLYLYAAIGFIFGALITRAIYIFFDKPATVIDKGQITLSHEEFVQFEALLKSFEDKREERLNR